MHYSFRILLNIVYNTGNVLRWERAVQDAEDKLESARQTESNQKAEIDHDEQQMEQLKSARNAKKMEVDQKEDEIGKARREVGAIAKDIQAAQKQLNGIETKIEQKKAERHAVLMQCKVCVYILNNLDIYILNIYLTFRWKISPYLCYMEIWKT